MHKVDQQFNYLQSNLVDLTTTLDILIKSYSHMSSCSLYNLSFLCHKQSFSATKQSPLPLCDMYEELMKCNVIKTDAAASWLCCLSFSKLKHLRPIQLDSHLHFI